MLFSKTSTRYERSSSSRASHSENTIPRSRRDGAIDFRKTWTWRSTSRSVWERIACSCSAGLAPPPRGRGGDRWRRRGGLFALAARPAESGGQLVLQAGDTDLEELVEILGE